MFIYWGSRRAFLCLISVYSNFLTNLKLLSPYLFLRASAIERFDGKRSLVRYINTKDITNSIRSYRAISNLLRYVTDQCT